ncbi:MAG: M67 family metallopeptidase [Deltaproteobacteria bacterium]|nr:M67 family metallopeptidase [Deltaproteobacteria bacterium]
MNLSTDLMKEIREHARAELPNEACGYVMGDGDRACALYKMTNADHSPVHFSFNPAEQFEALHAAIEMGKELIAVYHSHPETPARMSEEDIRKAHDTEIVYLIYAVGDDEIKGFTVTREKTVTEVPVEMVMYKEKA